MQLPLLRTLRARLILAVLLVQFVVSGILLLNVGRVWTDMVLKVTEVRVAELGRLLNAGLAPALAGMDAPMANGLLEGMRTPDGIDYLVLLDNQQKVISARGWEAATPLPEPTRFEQLRLGQKMPVLVHAGVTLQHNGIVRGTLRFGVSTEILRHSVGSLVGQSIALVVGGGVASALLPMLLSLWLTRRLYRLIEAADRSANTPVPQAIVLEGDDEISELATRFNRMVAGIQDRLDAFRKSEERFHAIADHTYSVEIWLSPEGELLWVNGSVTRLSGYTVRECMEMDNFPVPLAAIEERETVAQAIHQALTGTTRQDFEFRAQRRDGGSYWASMSWQPIYDTNAEYLGVRASIDDNTQLKEDRLALKRAIFELEQSQSLGTSYLNRAEAERARLTALLSAMRFGVLFVDNDNLVVFHNPAFKTLWLIDEQTPVIGKSIGQVLQFSLNRPAMYDLSTSLSVPTAEGITEARPLELHMNDGRIVTQQSYVVRDESGNPSGLLWIYEDVTQEHFFSERMTYLAERDALTGLYNRHAFQQQLGRMLADADRSQEALAVLYFDLDEFKYVNDTFGHGAGDELLKRVGQEISAQVRRNEFFARLGGDEFAILVPNCSEQEVSYLASRLVSTIAGIQFFIAEQTLRLSSSLGVALYPAHADNAEDLVAHADSAMYQAKDAGKATWRMYKAEADASREMVDRLSWNERIQHALENDGFVLYFQGIYDAATREVAHLEALVRMKDTRNPGQIIPPGQFIPQAEKSGRILDLDRWVIRESVGLLAKRPSMPSIAVNISGRSFDKTGLPEYIGDLLSSNNVRPERLMVELTETAAVADMRDAQIFIEALRATGCTVCLDDFGAGFSSFAYLKHLKAQVLKIDGLFVRDLPNDHDSQVFVRAIASMARHMGKQTVAEFVENEETLQMLVEFGVDMVQGYYLDRPVPNHPALNSVSRH